MDGFINEKEHAFPQNDAVSEKVCCHCELVSSEMWECTLELVLIDGTEIRVLQCLSQSLLWPDKLFSSPLLKTEFMMSSA